MRSAALCATEISSLSRAKDATQEHQGRDALSPRRYRGTQDAHVVEKGQRNWESPH